MSLDWVPLDLSVAQCGDGTPTGVYQDWSMAQPPSSSSTASTGSQGGGEQNYLLAVLGGGFCVTDQDCLNIQQGEPFRLTSQYVPQKVTGRNILSNNPDENPALYNFAKLSTYYCSQDLYLGSGVMRESGMYRHGDLYFQGVLDHLIQEHERMHGSSTSSDNTTTTTSNVNQLVVIGISAGATGVLNQIPKLRRAAERIGARQLKIVIDSSMMGDSAQLDLMGGSAAGGGLAGFDFSLIDLQEHPRCNLFQYNLHPTLSSIPCCMSPHCMARTGTFDPPESSSAATGVPSSSALILPKESFLLIDSTYDVLDLMITLRDMFPTTLLRTDNAEDVTDKVMAALEHMGSRKRATLETVYSELLPPGSSSPLDNFFGSLQNDNDDTLPSLAWIMPSCFTHGFMYPAREVHSLNCLNLGKEDFVIEDGLLGQDMFEIRCRSQGDLADGEYGIAVPFLYELEATLWYDQDVWEFATVQGKKSFVTILDSLSKTVSRRCSGEEIIKRLDSLWTSVLVPIVSIPPPWAMTIIKPCPVPVRPCLRWTRRTPR